MTTTEPRGCGAVAGFRICPVSLLCF